MGGAMNAGAAGVDAGGAGVDAGAGGTPAAGGAASSAGGADGGELDGASAKPDATTLGAPCLHAADCSKGLICLLASDNQFQGGGVANGVCTFDCSQDLIAVTPGESACAVLGPSAVCLQASSFKAYCVETCTLGPVPSNVRKCHGRQDMACADPDQTGVGFCTPTCRGDFDCGGRVCDLGSGVCKDSISSTRTLPTGAKCDPNAQQDICRGACVGILDSDGGTVSVGFCSGFCRLGEVGCGANPASSAPVASSCLFGTETISDLGDLGFCAPLCDCNDDCLDPDLVCTPVAGLEASTGRRGACSAPSAASPRGVSCGAVRDSGTD